MLSWSWIRTFKMIVKFWCGSNEKQIMFLTGKIRCMQINANTMALNLDFAQIQGEPDKLVLVTKLGLSSGKLHLPCRMLDIIITVPSSSLDQKQCLMVVAEIKIETFLVHYNR